MDGGHGAGRPARGAAARRSMLVRPESLRLAAPGAEALTAHGHRAPLRGAERAAGARGPSGETLVEAAAPPAAARVGEVVGVLPSRRSGGGMHLFQGKQP